MTLAQLLAEARVRLPDSETPYLDACLIMAHRLGSTRERLLARLSEEMEAPAGFDGDIGRRASGESVAYIVGHKEFFGREFSVDRNVLVPRPDTEILVEAALECGDALVRAGRDGHLRIHDLCTGSGAVALSIAAERPGWELSASDISADALAMASCNAESILKKDLRFFLADLFDGIEGPFELVTANPPYVTRAETDLLLEGGWGEPRIALDGGADGLDVIRDIIPAARRVLVPGGILLIEADGSQAERIRAMLESAGYGSIRSWNDLAGIVRVTGGSTPWTGH